MKRRQKPPASLSSPLARPLAGVALLITLLTLLTPATADACSCMAFPADDAKAAAMAWSMSNVIFVGEVVNVRAKRFRMPPMRQTTFNVLRSWKGLTEEDPAMVESAMSSVACGYRFNKPGTYLVFAHWSAQRQVLTTTMCDLNRLERDAEALIRELDKLKSAGTKKPPR